LLTSDAAHLTMPAFEDSKPPGTNPDADSRPPLTRDEVQALRQTLRQASPWRVLGWQVVVGLGVAALAFAFTRNGFVALSALYGAAAVVLPGALFARGLTGKVASMNAGAAVLGFFVWEFVKIALTVAMLVAAARVIQPLSWPALLVAMVLTMKVYWVALLSGKRTTQAGPGNAG
jgi:ATP synthase protein I